MEKKDTLLPLALVTVSFIWLWTSTIENISAQSKIEKGAGLNSNQSVEKFKGFGYGPHRDNEDPDSGIQPTIAELSEDLAFIKNLTTAIRTYGATDNLEQIPLLCQQYGIDCYPGAWISRFECENERQIDSLIQIANLNLSRVKGLIVGNEVLLRNDIPEERLIEFISRVRNATNLPVATAETWKDWLEHPLLVEAVDTLFVHIYAYWDRVAVENGADYVLQKWTELQMRYPGKPMILGETGWPSKGEQRGDAIPSEENQKRYLSDFVAMAESNNIDYFYFEIFDEKWKNKAEGEVGAHWGIYNSDGSLKPLMTDCVPEEARDGIDRPPRVITDTEASLPLYIYSDGCDARNGFFSSGWMGELAQPCENDTNCVGSPDILDESSADNPFSGESCIRISYTPSPGQWGGIYWQFPVNNWGEYPGYDLSKSLAQNAIIKLSFWVRGENGGEKAEFITGGINDPTLKYRDSYGPVSKGVITLKKDWEKCSFDLTGEDLSMVIGGFAWVTNYAQNPQGATIYLDEIVFEATIVDGVGDDGHRQPDRFALNQNFPNPFNPSTTISYQLSETAEVGLSIYNMVGQQVVTLVHENQIAGDHHVKWNGRDSNGQPVSDGIYIYRLTANKTLIDSKKMILLK